MSSALRRFTLGPFIVLLLVLLLTVVIKAGGELDPTVVGVKVGDWVKYSVTRLGAPTIWYGGLEKAVWVRVEVLDVSNTTVTIRETVHDVDGYESVKNHSWNLPDDRPYNVRPTLTRYIIAASLGPGDKVGEYPIWSKETSETVYVDLILNDTDYRSYGEVTREVNQLKFTWLVYEYPIVRNDTLEQYWEKSTGFLLEEIMQSYSIGYEEHPSTFKLEIVDTNMWEMKKPPQQPPWWLVTIPVGTVIAIVAVVKMRNHTKKNGADKQ